MVAELTPTQQRCADPIFVASLSFLSILSKLPFSWPVGEDVSPSPKRHYRCHYVYLGYEDLSDVTLWPTLSPFDLALRLVDFSSLEALLASMIYAPSARGHVPFHPVSMFLLYSWHILNGWNRSQALRNLADARYDDYRQRFGFVKGDYPTEGGLRHFETMLGSASDNEPSADSEPALSWSKGQTLIAQTVELARTLGCISREAMEHGILGVDGMIHDAASRMRCSSVDDRCERLIDPLWRTSWVLADGLLSANASEDKLATELMKGVVCRYDWVDWEFVVADAGEGRDPFLRTAYQMGLRRVVGLRADKCDEDVRGWAIRGYDDKGIPVCPFGYRLHPNGWDGMRRRYKWCCRRACQRQEDRPAPDCPHRWDGDKHGLVRDVGQSFPDGSNRLVRDVPYGSVFYKRLYGRGRNAAEERNSEFEALGLKSFRWKDQSTAGRACGPW